MSKPKPKILVFASGTKDGGGSGFENLVNKTRDNNLNMEIVGVVSNHKDGGVKRIAEKLNVPFHLFREISAENYRKIVQETGVDFVALSGWLKLVTGLDPRTTFNIHPARLPLFGGPGMYGHFAHEAVMAAYREKKILYTEVTMHFVTEKYDEGPVFFRHPVEIKQSDTSETLAERVKAAEHIFQPIVTELVANGEIRWDGKDPGSLIIPEQLLITPELYLDK